jgi:uncharacterized repeat protein (TIGR03943 family)
MHLRKSFHKRWQGLLLSLIAIVATVWLSVSGQLGLFIHPRYAVFTMVMCAVGGVLAIAGFVVLGSRDSEHEHENPERNRLIRASGSIALILSAAFALLVLPPAALTESTAQQREVNSSVDTGVAASTSGSMTVSYPGEEAIVPGTDMSTFTVRDWVFALQAGLSPQFMAANPAKVVGFVSPDQDDPENVFYVTLFAIACCAVDATPLGVAVYSPGWDQQHAVGNWVRVTGIFGQNPSEASKEQFALTPDVITPIDTPKDPYLF